jgi:hypothetical protein
VNLIPRPLAYGIMGLVTLVWAVNFAAQFFVEGYSSDPLVHGVFMTIVGGAMALAKKGPGGATPESEKKDSGGGS